MKRFTNTTSCVLHDGTMNIDFPKKRTLNLDRELMMFNLPLKQLLDKIDDPENQWFAARHCMLLFGNWSVLYLFYVECAGSMRPRLLTVFFSFRTFVLFFLSLFLCFSYFYLSVWLSVIIRDSGAASREDVAIFFTRKYRSSENVAFSRLTHCPCSFLLFFFPEHGLAS